MAFGFQINLYSIHKLTPTHRAHHTPLKFTVPFQPCCGFCPICSWTDDRNCMLWCHCRFESHLLVKWWNIIRLFLGGGVYLAWAFFPVRSYIMSTLKKPFPMWLTERIITNVLFQITYSGGTPYPSPSFNGSLNAFVACPLTETWLATQHLIRNHTFPSVNIAVCGVLIKCCTKTTGIPSDSFFSCSLSKNLRKKNPQIFLFLEFSHNPPLQVSE